MSQFTRTGHSLGESADRMSQRVATLFTSGSGQDHEWTHALGYLAGIDARRQQETRKIDN